MKPRKTVISSTIILSLLITILAQPALTQDSSAFFDWKTPGFDNHNTYYSPQTALNKTNIEQFEQIWMKGLTHDYVMFGNETTTSTSPLLLINGYLYYIDRSKSIIAMNADNGHQIWSEFLSISEPTKYGVEDEFVHVRFINSFDEKIWLIDLDCSIKGFNRISGTLDVEIPPHHFFLI